MAQARYLFRIDDVTPTMDWDRFLSVMSIFQEHGVRPLLGIVPENRDPRLAPKCARADFWDTMRRFQKDGLADLAQHGFQHVLTPLRLGSRIQFTEFAGFSYEEQLRRIAAGQACLREQGIEAKIWIAPQHSYDRTTLRALRDSGFSAISDEAGLFPFLRDGLVFVPQQFWRPRRMPCGVITILLHTDTNTDEEIEKIEAFVKQPLRFTSFSEEAANCRSTMLQRSANYCFRAAYHLSRAASGRTKKRSTRELDLLPADAAETLLAP